MQIQNRQNKKKWKIKLLTKKENDKRKRNRTFISIVSTKKNIIKYKKKKKEI